MGSGKVSCRVRLDRGGYVPGESICVNATIDNDSSVEIRKTKAVLTEVFMKKYLVKFIS